MTKRLMNHLKKKIHEIRQIKTIKELLLYPSNNSLEKLSAFVILLLLLTPFFRLFKSLMLKNHIDIFYYVNDKELGYDVLHYIWQIGYLGLFIGLFTLSRSILQYEANGPSFDLGG